jgi:hypothetical protein
LYNQFASPANFGSPCHANNQKIEAHITMYPEDLIAPMRAELTQAGFDELRDADAMKTAIQSEGTTLVVINSVCGCAAGSCRPGVSSVISVGSAVQRRRIGAHGGAPPH